MSFLDSLQEYYDGAIDSVQEILYDYNILTRDYTEGVYLGTSIATSLMLETMLEPQQTSFAPDRERPRNPMPKVLIFNNYTLVRNITEALDKTSRNKMIRDGDSEMVREYLKMEQKGIQDAFAMYPVKIYFITPAYTVLKTGKGFYTEATKRELLLNFTYKALEWKSKPLRTVKLKSDEVHATYIMTHVAHDLINIPKGVRRINSHSGVLDTQHKFSKTLNLPNGLTYEKVPLNKDTLIVFSDRLGIIPTQSRPVRAMLRNLLLSSKVTSDTSYASYKTLVVPKYEDELKSVITMSHKIPVVVEVIS